MGHDGKHRGLAVLYGFGGYVAACADVTVDAEGSLKIDRIIAATDCGTAVNPTIEAQVEGSFTGFQRHCSRNHAKKWRATGR